MFGGGLVVVDVFFFAFFYLNIIIIVKFLLLLHREHLHHVDCGEFFFQLGGNWYQRVCGSLVFFFFVFGAGG